GWRVRKGSVQKGVEIGWQFTAPQGAVRVAIHRLEQGPPAIRRLHIACALDNHRGGLDLAVEEGHRLAALPQGEGVAQRTVTVPPETPAELLARQLSDRER